MQTIQEIEDGDYKQRAEEDYHTEELQRLTQAFNRMMNVIVNLRIRAYDEKIQLMDTQMKYFQMQLKPHFLFKLSLTTIYSMSYQKRNEDIRTYIDALTKTVRYMFKGGLRLVLLKEETQHLENYFECSSSGIRTVYSGILIWKKLQCRGRSPRCCYIHLWKMNTNMQ